MARPPLPRVRTVLIALSKVLLLVAVVVWSGGEAATAVAGSPAAPEDYRFTVRLQIGDRRVCSGALVHPLWVLTAKSCFTPAGGPLQAGPPATWTTFFAGNVDLATEDHSIDFLPWVMDLVPHPDRDLVLAAIAYWEPDPGIAIATTPPRAGERLRVAGFGRTGTEWVPDRLHTATFTVGGVGNGLLAITPESPGAAICKGDAGGPAFREVDGRVELVAVHHTSWQAGCFTETETRQGATETRVDDIRAWISATTASPQLRAGDNPGYRGRGKHLCHSANGESQLSWLQDMYGSAWLSVSGNIPDAASQAYRGLAYTWPAGEARFQSDGNLVVYDSTGTGIWSTGTSGHPNARLVCEEDGGVTIYDGATPVWQSGTAPTLHASANYRAAGGPHGDWSRVSPVCMSTDRTTVLMADYGVLRSSDGWMSTGERWSSQERWTVRFQSDGNLVTYDQNDRPVWSSRTGGHPDARLVCQDSGSIAIYDGNTKLWDTADYPTGRIVSAAYDQCLTPRSRAWLSSCYFENFWTFNPDRTLQVTSTPNTCLVVGDLSIPEPKPCAPAHPNRLWQRGANGSLVNTATGKCLHAENPDAQLRMQSCNGSLAQRWTLRPQTLPASPAAQNADRTGRGGRVSGWR